MSLVLQEHLTERPDVSGQGDKGQTLPPGPSADQQGLPSPPVRIVIADDHALVRDGLSSLIDPQPDLQVVGHAGSVREAIRLAEQLRPDLILMDFTLPDGTGDEATRTILAARPETKIVFLTVHDDDERLTAAIAAGATGYLLKSIRAADLLDRLRGLARGDVALSPAIGRRILGRLAVQLAAHAAEPAAPPAAPPAPPLDPAVLGALSDREIALLRLIGQGYTNRLIADTLKVSLRTVEYHRANLAQRLGLHSRAELVRFAARQGLLPSRARGHQE